MVVGVLRLEVYLAESGSLKTKRSALKSLKDQLRNRFNVAVAEVDANDLWQRALLGVVTVGSDHGYVSGCLSQVVEWMRDQRVAELIKIEQEML